MTHIWTIKRCVSIFNFMKPFLCPFIPQCELDSSTRYFSPRGDCFPGACVIDQVGPGSSLAGIRPDTICFWLAAAVQRCCIRWCLDGVGLVLFSPPGVSLCVWLLHAGFHHVVPLLTCLATTGSLEWRGEERLTLKKYRETERKET